METVAFAAARVVANLEARELGGGSRRLRRLVVLELCRLAMCCAALSSSSSNCSSAFLQSARSAPVRFCSCLIAPKEGIVEDEVIKSESWALKVFGHAARDETLSRSKCC